MTLNPVSHPVADRCTICGEPTVPTASAACNACGETYHLVLTRDLGDGKNCGEVWLNEEFLALEFACARCLAAHRGVPYAPPGGAPEARGADPPRSRPTRHTGVRARDLARRRRS